MPTGCFFRDCRSAAGYNSATALVRGAEISMNTLSRTVLAATVVPAAVGEAASQNGAPPAGRGFSERLQRRE
jgi:hypothetical protein